MTVVLVDAPEGWALDDSSLATTAEPAVSADAVLLFLRHSAGMVDRVSELIGSVYPAGFLWTLWPRRAAGHSSDLGDQIIRTSLLPLGIVDTKVAAVDTDWSGLKFVWRSTER